MDIRINKLDKLQNIIYKSDYEQCIVILVNSFSFIFVSATNIFSNFIYQFHKYIITLHLSFSVILGTCERQKYKINKIAMKDNSLSILAWTFLFPAHVHVICSIWRLLLALHCNFVILLKVIAQQPLKSKWDKRLQVFTICITVSKEISERFRLADLRQCSGGLSRAPRGLAQWFRTSLNTGSSRQGTAISESFWRSEEPLSSAHSTPFRDLQHNAGFICCSSREKLLGKKTDNTTQQIRL